MAFISANFDVSISCGSNFVFKGIVAVKAEPIFAAKVDPISDIWGVNIENFNI